MIDIKIKHWDYSCGDGCCSDWGVQVSINDDIITEYANSNLADTFERMMLKLGYKPDEFKIEESNDY